MSKIYLTICLTLITWKTYSQTSIISSDGFQEIYLGIPNVIIAMTEKYPCKSTKLYTNNGNLKLIDNCTYLWVPDSLGSGTIFHYFFSKKDSILISYKPFNINRFPQPIFKLAFADNGVLNLSDLLLSDGPIIKSGHRKHMQGLIMNKVKGYSIIAIRDNKTIFLINNLGNNFTAETKEYFKTLKEFDQLIFFNIKSYYDGHSEPVAIILK